MLKANTGTAYIGKGKTVLKTLLIFLVTLSMSSYVYSKEVLQLNTHDVVTIRHNHITFSFQSPSLPGIDLEAICAGDFSQIGPLLTVVEPYAGNIHAYTFTSGVEGPLCKKLGYSRSRGAESYVVTLTQTLGPYSLWEIEAGIDLKDGRSISSSFSGMLFKTGIEEHDPTRWIPVSEAHELALKAILENANPEDIESIRSRSKDEQHGFLATGRDYTDDGLIFIPSYYIEILGYTAVVDRLTGTVEFFDPPQAMH